MKQHSLSIFPTHICLTLVACMLTVLASGCGPSYEGPQRAKVTGTVNHNGAPVKNGTINLRPESDGGRVAGGSIVDGKYEILEANGPTLGEYKVEIFAFEPIGGGSSGGDAEEDEKTRQVLPQQFNAKTTLTLKVDSPDVTKDFDLK